jgi:hypothetical protein
MAARRAGVLEAPGLEASRRRACASTPPGRLCGRLSPRLGEGTVACRGAGVWAGRAPQPPSGGRAVGSAPAAPRAGRRDGAGPHQARTSRDPGPWTRSELERGFLELIRGHGLPEPASSVLVDGHVVDFHWPTQGLVVEVDGYEFHRSRQAFENDRARDAALQLAGVRVIRVTHRRIGEPAILISQLRALLEAA